MEILLIQYLTPLKKKKHWSTNLNFCFFTKLNLAVFNAFFMLIPKLVLDSFQQVFVFKVFSNFDLRKFYKFCAIICKSKT